MVVGFTAFLKYILFVFNFFIWIAGLALIGIGAYCEAVNKTYVTVLIENESLTVPIFLIILGVLATVVGFLGCWGAIRESSTVLLVFSVVVFLLVVGEIGGGAYAVSKKEQLKETAAKSVINSMMKYNRTNDTSATEMWNFFQMKFDCCGVINYTDWMFLNVMENVEITFPKEFNPFVDLNPQFFKSADKEKIAQLLKTMNMTFDEIKDKYEKYVKDPEKFKLVNVLPRTCCTGIRRKDTCKTDNIKGRLRTQGCVHKLIQFVEKYADVLAGVAIGFGVLQIAGIFVSCYVAYKIRDEESKRSG